jgi:hypothetical protein
MNSLPVVYDPSVASSASSAGRAVTLSAPAITAPAIADAGAAANDEAEDANANTISNPLWIIAIGMGFFFALVAAVTALD